MRIYDQNNKLILDIQVDDNSYRNRAIMGDNSLILYYSLAEHIELPVGAFCVFEGETYTLFRPEQFKMKHTRLYEYTVTFSSEQDKAKIWKFRNPVDGRLKFPLTAKPIEHLQMFVDNMNRRDAGWTIGDCIDDVEKPISYDHDYCWDALAKMATEFDTEFEMRDKRVSLHKVEYNKSRPLPLSYGKGNGFKSGVGRSNSGDTPPVETLFVQGGDRNIDRSKYPSDEKQRASSNGCLLLPDGQTIAYDGEHFEDEPDFNNDLARHYRVDDLGLSIRNIDRVPTTLAEDSLDRSDDYPKRIGRISNVISVNKEKNFYDLVDTDIPDGLDYEDYLIKGETMAIIFQSGMLAGKEFDVKYFHKPKNLNGVLKDGKRFEIVPQEIDGITMPCEGFIPKEGDTYAVFHVMLPDAYIRNDVDKSGASWDMFRSAVRYLYDNEERKFTFTGELDGIWAKRNWPDISPKLCLGGFILFRDDSFEKEGVLVRITGIKDYINSPHSPKIELSNETVSTSVSSTIKQLEASEVTAEENMRASLQFTKRRFRDAKETIEMVESALSDNFSSRVNPIAVETMSLLVGDERLQFQFVDEPQSSNPIPHIFLWDKETRQFSATNGTIQHMTLGVDSIKPLRDSSGYLYWNVDSFESETIDDSDTRFYFYIRAQKEYSGNAGHAEFRLEAKAHKLEEGDYYWLLAGILNSEYDGDRSFVPLYGFTEVLPGQITTRRIISADGSTYFDLEKGEICGNIRFLDSSTDNSGVYITLISGGKIKSELIDSDSIVASHFVARDPGGEKLTSINEFGDGIICHYYPGSDPRVAQFETGTKQIVTDRKESVTTVARYYDRDGRLRWWLGVDGYQKNELSHYYETLTLIPPGSNAPVKTAENLTAYARDFYRLCSTSTDICNVHGGHSISTHNGEIYLSTGGKLDDPIPDGTYYSPLAVKSDYAETSSDNGRPSGKVTATRTAYTIQNGKVTNTFMILIQDNLAQ